jgi:hypothetical protein
LLIPQNSLVIVLGLFIVVGSVVEVGNQNLLVVVVVNLTRLVTVGLCGHL